MDNNCYHQTNNLVKEKVNQNSLDFNLISKINNGSNNVSIKSKLSTRSIKLLSKYDLKLLILLMKILINFIHILFIF